MKTFDFEKGYPEKVFRVVPDRGISGGALECVDVLPRNGRIFYPAKGNLALRVLKKRGDGRHELASIVAFANVGDRLAFTPGRKLELTVKGPTAAAAGPVPDPVALCFPPGMPRMMSMIYGMEILQTPGVIAVIIGPVKKSSAATIRDPAESRRTTPPFNVTSTSGISAAGSTFATEPPIVPRLWPRAALRSSCPPPNSNNRGSSLPLCNRTLNRRWMNTRAPIR